MSIYIFSLDGVPYLTFNCQWRLGKSGTSGRRLQAFCSTVSRIVCTLFDSHVTRAICLLWMEKLIQFETDFFLSMRFLLILYKLCCCWNCFQTVLISRVYLLQRYLYEIQNKTVIDRAFQQIKRCLQIIPVMVSFIIREMLGIK